MKNFRDISMCWPSRIIQAIIYKIIGGIKIKILDFRNQQTIIKTSREFSNEIKLKIYLLLLNWYVCGLQKMTDPFILVSPYFIHIYIYVDMYKQIKVCIGVYDA